MKVMQAYNATSNESPILLPQAPIAPTTILPSSLKRAHSRSSSSNSTLPQVFEIGESSHKTSLERHEEQNKTILNHLDELPVERIEQVEEKIEGLGNGRDFYSRNDHRGYLGSPSVRYEESSGQDPMASNRISTSTTPAMNQAAIRKLVVDSVAAALEAQAATMAYTDNTNRNTEQSGTPIARKLFSRSNCTEDCKVKFATGTLTGEALSWWNSFAQPIGNDLKTYIKRFKELAVFSPTMVLNSEELMEVFIERLPRSIEGNVTASKPQTLEEAITITQRLMEQ
nr:hypothetical protein [Tanacetum cinerariifolium]